MAISLVVTPVFVAAAGQQGYWQMLELHELLEWRVLCLHEQSEVVRYDRLTI